MIGKSAFFNMEKITSLLLFVISLQMESEYIFLNARIIKGFHTPYPLIHHSTQKSLQNLPHHGADGVLYNDYFHTE